MEQASKNGNETIIDEMAQILFTNLLLLGMDMPDMETHTKISFNKDMFNLPNKGGAEAVLHFLFYRLNPSLSDERFRDCWPIIDKKREMQFRKTCNSWIVTIQKNDEDAHLPKLNPALLLSPGGRKFIHFLYSFSSYVLTSVMKKEHDWKPNTALVYPSITPGNKCHGSVMSSSIKDSTVAEMKVYFNHLHLISGANRSWKAYSDELVKEYRGLTKKMRDMEQEKRRMVNVIADTAIRLGCSLPAKRTLTMFDSDMGALGIKRGQRIEQARSRWKVLNNFFELFNKKREVVQSIVDHSITHHRLEGAGVGVCVPGLLLREFKKEIQQQQIDSVYVGGRLNLVPVLQMWNLCLRRYLEQITSEDLPDVSKEVSDLNTQAHKHHSFLKDAHSLRDEMTNVIIPELEKSIQELREKLNNSKDFNCAQSSLGLELTKPTSPVTAPPGAEMASDSPFNALMSRPTKKDTPDAVAAVIQSVVTKSQGSKNVLPSRLVHAFRGLNQNEQTPQSVPRRGDTVKRKVASRDVSSRSSRSKPVTNDASSKLKSAHAGISHKQPVNQSSSSSKSNRSTTNPSRQKLLDKATNIERNTNVASSPVITKRGNSHGNHKNSKALDFLANSIVDSVMLDDAQSQSGSSDFMKTDEMNSSPLSEILASELEMSAFISHDRLGRSPQGSDTQRNESIRFLTSPTCSEGKSFKTYILNSPGQQLGTSASSHVSSKINEATVSVGSKGAEWRSPKASSPETCVRKELISATHSESAVSDESMSNLLAGEDDINNPFSSFLSNPHSKSLNDSNASSTKSKASDRTRRVAANETHLLSHSSSPSDTSVVRLTGNPKTSPAKNDTSDNVTDNFRGDHTRLPKKFQTDVGLSRRERTNEVAYKNINHLLGDRPCGDGEASEESFPASKVIYSNSDSNFRNSRLLSLETEDSELDENDIDLVLHTSRLMSSFTSRNEEDRQQSVNGDEKVGLFCTNVSKLKVHNEVAQSFLDISGDMEGLDDLVESDVDDGLNESFAPLKQGMHIDNSPMQRAVGLESASPLIKTKQISAESPDFLQHLLSSPSLGSPFPTKSGKRSPPMPINMPERLAQIQAAAALIYGDSDDSL